MLSDRVIRSKNPLRRRRHKKLAQRYLRILMEELSVLQLSGRMLNRPPTQRAPIDQ
ncbi:hypothetical protein Ssi02_26700 [Sinosporangium siamense]|uniref:Uncharacterized protein n=1 Tax=Sinosporangium siamense TaxID=1367973 RepID=A0A919RIF7_9ACTN|nr:hypothetical protein Ssi02_26700 [Sinosporangium siamense]